MPQVKCRICLKEFYSKPSHQAYGWGKFCSIICRSKAQLKGKLVKCDTCSKKVYRAPKLLKRSKSGKFFCSKSCQALWRNSIYTEDKSPNWKDGQSAYRRILIRSGKKQLCTLCKLTDKRVLIAHHIDHNRKNNKLANLTWLCFNCHYLVHHHRELEKKLMEMLV